MARDATLFDEADGSPLRGYLLMKQSGGNIPPAWIDRAQASRKAREAAVSASFKKGHVAGIVAIEEWETAYRKECFYYGIRVLFEIERNGKTKL